MKMENTSIVVENVRLSYVHLLKPYGRDPMAKQKYSVTILLPKSDVEGKQKVDAAIAAATRNGIANKWNGAAPAKVPTPVWDGDGLTQNGNKFGPECAGHWVFAASTPADKPVDVVDGRMNCIIDATQVYSGIYANVCVNFFAYNYQGKRASAAASARSRRSAMVNRSAGPRRQRNPYSTSFRNRRHRLRLLSIL